MEFNLKSDIEYYGFEGFEGTGLELFKHSLDAKTRSLLTKLGILLGLGVIALSWVFLMSLIYILVFAVIVLAFLLVIYFYFGC